MLTAASSKGNDISLQDRKKYISALVGEKQYQQAWNECEKVLKLDPEDAVTLHNAAVSLHGLKRYSEALEMCQHSLKIRPESSVALVALGGILYGLKNYKDAITAYERALTIQPNNPGNIYHNMSLALKALGDLEHALLCCNKALETRPNDAVVLSTRENLLRLIGKKVTESSTSNSKKGTQLVSTVKVTPQNDVRLDIVQNQKKNGTKILEGHRRGIQSLQPLPNNQLASASEDGTIKIWDMNTGKCLRTLTGPQASAAHLALLPTGELISSGCGEGANDRTICVWDLTNGICIKIFYNTNHIIDLQSLPNGRIISIAFYDKTIKIWDLKSENFIKCLKGHHNDVDRLLLLPSGELASGSTDCTIKIWNIETDECIQTLEGHTKGISSLRLMHNDQLASGSWDYSIKLWDIKSGKCIRTLKGHNDRINYLREIQEGILLSNAGKDFKIWDLNTGACIRTISDKVNYYVTALELLPSNELIIGCGGSDDPGIKIFDISEFFPEYKITKSSDLQQAVLSDSSAISTNIDASSASELANAFKEQLRYAEANNVEAQAYVGWAYETGNGVTQSNSNAIAWYQKASLKGNEYAKERLKELQDMNFPASMNSTVTSNNNSSANNALLFSTPQNNSAMNSAALEMEKKYQAFRQQMELSFENLAKRFNKDIDSQLRQMAQKMELIQTPQMMQEQINSLCAQLEARLHTRTPNVVIEESARLNVELQKVEEELKRLNLQMSEIPSLKEQLQENIRKLEPLHREFINKQITLRQQESILSNLLTRTFYNRIQIKLNQIFTAYVSISSKAIDRAGGDVNTAIDIFDSAINVLSLGLGKIITKGVEYIYNRKKQKEINNLTEKYFVSLTICEIMVEQAARSLTLRYKEQILQLTEPGEESFRDKITFSKNAHGGAEALADSAVLRILEALSEGTLDPEKELDQQMVECVFTADYSKSFLSFDRKKIAAKAPHTNWTDEGVFQRTGLMVHHEGNVQYYKGKDKCNEPEKYGYRSGKIEEVYKLGLMRDKGPTYVNGSQISSALAQQYNNTIQKQLDLTQTQELQAQLQRRKDEEHKRELELHKRELEFLKDRLSKLEKPLVQQSSHGPLGNAATVFHPAITSPTSPTIPPKIPPRPSTLQKSALNAQQAVQQGTGAPYKKY